MSFFNICSDREYKVIIYLCNKKPDTAEKLSGLQIFKIEDKVGQNFYPLFLYPSEYRCKLQHRFLLYKL